MNLIFSVGIIVIVFLEIEFAHRYFRKQKRICATYPFYKLRDQVIWELVKSSKNASNNERLYILLNRIVHYADTFGWKFISSVVAETTETFLRQDVAPKEISKLQLKLAELVVQSARNNSLIVRFALSRPGRLIIMIPIIRGILRHHRNKNSPECSTSENSEIPTQTVKRTHRVAPVRDLINTTRNVVRLDNWRHRLAA